MAQRACLVSMRTWVPTLSTFGCRCPCNGCYGEGREDRRILETHWLVSQKGKGLVQWRLSLVNTVESNQGGNKLSSGSLCMHAYRHRHLHIHAHTTNECIHTFTHIHTHIHITHSSMHIHTCVCTLTYTTHVHTPTQPFKWMLEF